MSRSGSERPSKIGEGAGAVQVRGSGVIDAASFPQATSALAAGSEEVAPTTRIPLSSVDLTDVERSNVADALASGWISGTGRFVDEFERRVSAWVGRRYVIAVNSGTSAIELALRALDIGNGDEVVTSAFSFAAPAMSVLAVGATPVLADVSPETWTLSPESVAKAMTSRTRAILAVDVLGHPADYARLEQFGVPVIEDAAQAHGSRYRGRMAGSCGIVSVFSFHANKAITTGEGGCVCTDSDELAQRMRLIAHHGMRPDRPYVHDVIGRNFRMGDLAAAVGVGQMERRGHLIEARRQVSRSYDAALADTPCQPRPVASWAEYTCWLYTIAVDNRVSVLRHLHTAGIDARAVWPALTEQPVLRRTGPPCPISEELARRVMWLPTYNALTAAQIAFITSEVDIATRASRGMAE